MPTRIGDLAQNQRLTASMLSTQTRLRAAQAAAASGKAATRFDQIAGDAGQLVRLKDTRALKAAFVDQSERLTGRLQLMDQALGSIVDIADRARASLVQRLDGGIGDAVPIDAEVDGMLAELRARAQHPDRRPVSVRRQPHRHRTRRSAGRRRHHRRSVPLLSGRRGQADGAGRCGRRGRLRRHGRRCGLRGADRRAGPGEGGPRSPTTGPVCRRR